MEFNDFLGEMADLLEVEASELVAEFELNSENYDSVVIVSTIALIDEYFDITVNGKALSKVSSIGELLELIKKKKEIL